ncbi:MAG: antibiotic biosynthesis monooxygenase [Thermoleophilia bacterium]|jgi:heme-degrading monooxygenase HmoA
MVYVVIEHKVEQRAEFERIFTGDTERRRSMGSKGGRLLVNTKDPDIMFIMLEWSDKEQAEKFADSLHIEEAWKWASKGIWSRVAVIEDMCEIDA